MKELKFTLAGATAVTQLGGKIAKEDLYGEVRRLVERDGRSLERGYLLPDGALVRRSQLSSVAIDAEGTPAEPPQMLCEGQPVELCPSSFEKESALGPVPIGRLVGFAVADVYDVDAGGLTAGLYETTFNYRKSHSPREALLLVKENGEAFLLIGSTKLTSFVGKKPAYEFFDAAEDDGTAEVDPLDFSMM